MGQKIRTNEFGQAVMEYSWEEFQQRMLQRMPYTGYEDLSGKTLVIRHTWGIGDMLYMTPALKAIKEKFPTMKLIVICTYPEVFQNAPFVDEVYHWRQFEDTIELSDRLSKDRTSSWYYVTYDTALKGGYDYKIHLRSKPQLNEFLASLLTKKRGELSGDEQIFFDQASNAALERYRMVALDMYCWHLHVDPKEKSIYYYPYESELAAARQILEPLRKKKYKIVTLMPHSSTQYKDYPHWKEVIRLLPWNYFWLILGSHSRAGESWSGVNVSDFTGAFQFRQSAAMVIEADLCCSSDTGLLYIKAARGGNCVVTYGPHEPQPFLHYFPTAHGLRVKHLQKTPGMGGMCSVGCYIDTTSCHKAGEFPPCLNELDPKTVADKIQEVVEGPRKS